MKALILMGSPRKSGNTNALMIPFAEELSRRGIEHDMVWLYDKNIAPCTACRACQKDWTVFGCRFEDDVQPIFDAILESDVIVLATPIYSWYCTPPMKALLDRLVYGMNKYYGDEKGPSLWRGKKAVLITTCGYPVEKGADLWEGGMKRYCRHSQLHYLGMLAEHDSGYAYEFMNDERKQRAGQFARDICESGSF